MPFGDGTGPLGQGPRIGRGMGRGRSRMRSNAGPGGSCICPNGQKRLTRPGYHVLRWLVRIAERE
jgi:hypothetical protein